jgi:dTDP-4-dehydrorhamnose 3,5-epimerase
MKIHTTDIEGLLIIQPKVFHDERGYFYEAFRADLLSGYGLEVEFVQDNISKSVKNTIRGLHYQVGKNVQGKLCQVISGKVLDIALDIRHNSPTYGQYFALELSDENHTMLWIPPGFAHGFSVLSDHAVFMYRCTAYYSKEDERAILFNDPDLNIDWLVDSPLVSEKDMKSKRFREIDPDFVFEEQVKRLR